LMIVIILSARVQTMNLLVMQLSPPSRIYCVMGLLFVCIFHEVEF
jgi:hypothetical protein